MRGVPMKMHTAGRDENSINNAVKLGPHMFAKLHKEFLSLEFIDMINLGQCVILPFSIAKKLTNLHVSPLGVVLQRGRRPWWICDYKWSGVNPNTIPLVPQEAMQYGRALERYLRHILLADPRYGPIYMLKCDLADGYYRLNLVIVNQRLILGCTMRSLRWMRMCCHWM